MVPVACRRRSHAGKPHAARVLFRHRVDYRTVPTTVGHGCTMDADSGATDHAARSRRGTIAARGFRISALGVLTRRLAPGTTAASVLTRKRAEGAARERLHDVVASDTGRKRRRGVLTCRLAPFSLWRSSNQLFFFPR